MIGRTLILLLVLGALQNVAWGDSPQLREGTSLVQAGQYRQARQVFFEGIDAGDPACMDYLGYLYLDGLGGEERPLIAFGLFQEAAHLGDVNGCRNLGEMYYLARYIDPDVHAAIHWLRKASDLGSERAAFWLGQIYFIGDGLEPNRELAIEIWKQAAGNGSESAAVALAAVSNQAEELTRYAERGNLVAQGTIKSLQLKKEGKPLVDVHFIHQGWNFCGVASSTMLCQFHGGKVSQYDFARLRKAHQWGEGSHWDELAEVATRFDQKWKIEDFPLTDAGFDDVLKTVAEKLKQGQPVIIDIREDPENPGAHSILACGYDPDSKQLLVRNPNQPFPGFQVFSETRLKEIWRSSGYLPDIQQEARAIMYAEK